MANHQWLIAGTFVAYVIAMLAIGAWSFLRTENLSDYILGGRRLGPLPAALSAGASDMSGWLLLGLPGYAYLAGFEAIWIAAGLLVGTWLNWQLVAARLRQYSIIANDSLTIPDYFENRFDDHSHALRVISAFFILLFFLFYTSSGLVAGGKLFETVFGLSYQNAVIAGSLAIVSYTLFGGFLAVAWTDVVQGLLMSAALIVVPIFALNAMGGWNNAAAATNALNPALLNAWTSAEGAPLSAIAVISLLGWGLGYFGQPHILARFKAVRKPRHIPAARNIAVTWCALALCGALACGFFAISYFDQPLADGETAFMLLIQSLFSPVVAGVLLAAILAAIMSTADSQLLVCSAALTEDFYKSLYRKKASQKELVRISRIAVILIAALATAVALSPDAGVLDLVSYAWAGFGAAFGPVILLSLYWKRITRSGALAGIVAGGVTVVVWKQLSGGIFDLYEIVPGFAFSTLAAVAASLLSSRPAAAVVDKFNQTIAALES